MAYQHDIFVSYMHDPVMEPWVHSHLLPFLRTFVANALNRPIQLFVDRGGIASGDTWPLHTKRALAHSRCLLAVWSPLYFHSEWCRRECAAMLYREQQKGFRTLANPHGLVVPVNVFDGQFFPLAAQQIQHFDLRDYWIVGDGFAKTEKYVAFQDRIREWAPQVAMAVQRAPTWDNDWLSADWLDVPDELLLPPPSDNFAFAGLA